MGDDTSTYDEAVASVGHGVPEAVAAAAIVAKMTPDEKLWCLDGDLPFWAGLDDLKDGGYHKRPFPAARIERLGVPEAESARIRIEAIDPAYSRTA